MSLTSFLLKLAIKILEQVLSEITKQLNRVQNEVLNEAQRWVTQGFDDIWRGEDADQFKEKVQKLAVPDLQDIIQVVTNTHNGLQNAADIIVRADQKAYQAVSDLAGLYAKI
ncbi:MAG: hypothetical protein K8I82_13740 [Anaerolineae bacterium]|nr:hypothetical protein [Anaerolineae bacterium]